MCAREGMYLRVLSFEILSTPVFFDVATDVCVQIQFYIRTPMFKRELCQRLEVSPSKKLSKWLTKGEGEDTAKRGVMVPEVRISTINSITENRPEVLQRPTQLMTMKQVSSTKGIYNIKVTYSHETSKTKM